MELEETPTFNEGTLLLNKYVVVRTVFGGMGEIIFCRDSKSPSKEIVVLKTFRDESLENSEAAEIFIREAEAWLRLGQLDYCLGLRDIVEIENKPYLVMDYCSGGSLREILKETPLPLNDGIHYATQILIGLLDISNQSIIHRDLKPENILFDDEGDVKITDLGIVRFLKTYPLQSLPTKNQSSQSTSASGTLPYMAPEQLQGDTSMDSGVDIWAFGVVVLEMLTGRRPFNGSNPEEIVAAILFSEPNGLNRLPKTAPKDLSKIISKCLKKNRSERYGSFKELVTDWDRIIKLENSPKHEGLFSYFTQDERVDISGSKVNARWNFSIFPERIPDGKELVVYSFSAARGLEDARNYYYKLDLYENAIESTSKAIGELTNGNSTLTRFLRGERFVEQSRLKTEETNDGKTRSVIQLSESEVKEALAIRLKSYVSIIQERETGKDTLPQFLTLCEAITESSIQDKEILNLCAQGYMLAEDYEIALNILHNILDDDPYYTAAWNTLFICHNMSGDIEKRNKVAKIAVETIGNNNKFLDQYVCARILMGVGDWGGAIFFGERALKLKSSDTEVLNMLCIALLNSGQRDEAYSYYQKLRQLAPNSSPAKKLASKFASVLL